ncbi:hypothetical protein [Lysinibacillus cavernae]|nr:hypothetical protein [Lysinibacillus cavernae]
MKRMVNQSSLQSALSANPFQLSLLFHSPDEPHEESLVVEL